MARRSTPLRIAGFVYCVVLQLTTFTQSRIVRVIFLLRTVQIALGAFRYIARPRCAPRLDVAPESQYKPAIAPDHHAPTSRSAFHGLAPQSPLMTGCARQCQVITILRQRSSLAPFIDNGQVSTARHEAFNHVSNCSQTAKQHAIRRRLSSNYGDFEVWQGNPKVRQLFANMEALVAELMLHHGASHSRGCASAAALPYPWHA